jgi:hypothetical protein
MSPLYRSVFNIPQMVVAQKRRSRAHSSTGTEVNSFPVYGVTPLTQALVPQHLIKRLALILSPVLESGVCLGQGQLATCLIQTKHGAVLAVPFAS